MPELKSDWQGHWTNNEMKYAINKGLVKISDKSRPNDFNY